MTLTVSVKINSTHHTFNNISHYIYFLKEISFLKCSFFPDSSIIHGVFLGIPQGRSIFSVTNCLVSLNRSSRRIVESGPDLASSGEACLGEWT